jgi:cysteinyl-tRNA synthetase
MGAVLGLLQQDPDAYLKRARPAAGAAEERESLSDAEIESRLAARRAARGARNFREADRIRDELSAAGVLLEDKPSGLTEWRRA